MRILIVSHSYIVDLNCEKLRQLAQLDPHNQVMVVVPQTWRPGGVQNRLIQAPPWQDGNFQRLPVANFSQNNQAALMFGWPIVKILRQFQPDIIQVEQGAKSLAYAQLITLSRLLRLRASHCLFTWWNLPYTNKFPIDWIEGYNLAHTDGLIAGNQDGVNILRDHGYRRAATVMPQLGVDERLFKPQPQPELRSQLKIAPGQFVVGFVGRFVAEKGILTLLDALAGLRDQDWILLLLGRGELAATIRRKAATLAMGDRLRWVETVPHDQVPDYINMMNCLVLPSETTQQVKTLTAVGWKEQFGHVLIEAMACAVPVIGSDSGEIPHVIGEAGLIFPEGNGEELGDRLRTLITSPDTAKTLGEKGYQRAMTHYTNRALAEKQLAFYRQIRGD
ncbi:MAG: glycosyltransferase family 4 protein [Spirulina sp. DLM2.Bin59]|nr:MAG: glycosyltransferase family 4 protein [Spirulina sp. DLM2.Bin59]